jgi:hypothetical protein
MTSIIMIQSSLVTQYKIHALNLTMTTHNLFQKQFLALHRPEKLRCTSVLVENWFTAMKGLEKKGLESSSGRQGLSELGSRPSVYMWLQFNPQKNLFHAWYSPAVYLLANQKMCKDTRKEGIGKRQKLENTHTILVWGIFVILGEYWCLNSGLGRCFTTEATPSVQYGAYLLLINYWC